MAIFINFYDCPCGESWCIESDGTHNDKCPKCNAECQPTLSKDLKEKS